MARGLLDEVETLLAAGYGPELPALTGLGYRQMIQHLRGELTLEEAVEEVKRQTRRFVRQQGTWFRLDDPRIVWFDLEQTRVRRHRAVGCDVDEPGRAIERRPCQRRRQTSYADVMRLVEVWTIEGG